MTDRWEVVSFSGDEELKKFLREEGIPESELAKELAKLRKNAEVSVRARAVLITPEVDVALQKIFKRTIFGEVSDLTLKEVQMAKEALWPQ